MLARAEAAGVGRERPSPRGGRAAPEVVVELIGGDGNAFAILGAVTRALRDACVPRDEVDAFMEEETSGDYDHLLETVMQWVEVT